jgi:hypothetical protein
VIRIETVAGYLLVVAIMALLYALGRLRPRAVAPFGELVSVVMVDRATRIAIMVCWWWLGWHFLVGRTV